jgi:signal transduction histidine kinase/CheY-like chemotaxis protein
MFFGGINGLNAFHPDLMQDNPFLPPVVITGFDIYGQPVAAGPDGPLTQPIETTQAIQLPYTDDFFEFAYAALHFSAPEQIQYAYTMEGLDRGWNLVGNRRFASYTNVPPGDYTFRVRATNSDGVWNEQGTALRIVIPPPFWQTTWFRLLVAAGLLGAFSGVFVLRIRAVEAQRQRLEVQVDERTQELRRTMEELERSKDAAEAASRAKSTFLANMSHEFRTPLNAILGFTQIMTRDKRLPPDHRQDIDIIYRSGEHLLGLINDVLDMSKIEAGRMRLNQRGFDLVRMLQGLEEMFALRAEQKGLALRLDLGPGVPRYVTGDDGKLRQVLMNLLGNAVKFTDQGQVVLRVHSASPPLGRGEATGLWVRFQVEDTGSGILPEELQQIFVPFVQSSSAEQAAEGTGLGLAISQQYVRLMGGEIQVSSEPGKGSHFQFTLPLEAVSASDLEKPPPTRRVAGLAPDQPAWRLLVVDDSEVNRKLLVKIFRPVGFEVREAANGVEALAAWEAWEPHLIWLDMRMPVMDGYETTRRIKATTRGMATVIIALTASALEEDKAVILSEGCDDYLRKPFREEDLFDAIARHLGVRYLYEEIGPKTAPEPGQAGQPAGDDQIVPGGTA